MLTFHHVSKAYSKSGIRKVIFDDLTFEFPKNRNVAIMGKNGAGKSTMMRLLAGSEPPDSGQVFRGLRVSWPLGFTGGFNGTMTGLENIRFVARIYGQDTEQVVDYVSDFAELGPSIRLPVKTYSTGMRARLAFGLSMAIDFQVYLIDEITAVGDDSFKRKSNAVFKNKLESSQIIMISHSEATIKSYCDCGLLLDDGHITFFDDVSDLVAAYKC